MNTEKARQILISYQYGGGFYNHLYNAVVSADKDNLRLLKKSFPGLVDAYCDYTGINLKEVIV